MYICKGNTKRKIIQSIIPKKYLFKKEETCNQNKDFILCEKTKSIIEDDMNVSNTEQLNNSNKTFTLSKEKISIDSDMQLYNNLIENLKEDKNEKKNIINNIDLSKTTKYKSDHKSSKKYLNIKRNLFSKKKYNKKIKSNRRKLNRKLDLKYNYTIDKYFSIVKINKSENESHYAKNITFSISKKNSKINELNNNEMRSLSNEKSSIISESISFTESDNVKYESKNEFKIGNNKEDHKDKLIKLIEKLNEKDKFNMKESNFFKRLSGKK